MEKEERQHHAFLYWLGTVILRREKDASGNVSIDDDHELLEKAFRAGWSWGKTFAEGPDPPEVT